eukprot:3932597-Rhodomonas_salina.1
MHVGLAVPLRGPRAEIAQPHVHRPLPSCTTPLFIPPPLLPPPCSPPPLVHDMFAPRARHYDPSSIHKVVSDIFRREETRDERLLVPVHTKMF